MSPSQRREVVEAVRRELGPEKVSERRACKVLGQPRGVQRYTKLKRPEDEELLKEMRAISRRRTRYGSPRMTKALRRRGRIVNHKRVERLWKEHSMQVPKKQRKRKRGVCGGSENSCVRKRPERPNHIWSYDFVEEVTEKGRKLRMLVVIDEFTREALAIEVGWSFTAAQVVDVLGYLFAVRGAPEHIRSDNGPEFVAHAVTRWLYQAGVQTLFVAKGSPWENGYVESFNSRFRDECLNRELFVGIEDARWVVDHWRLDYNHHRMHSSLNYQTPAQFADNYFADRCLTSASELASATPQQAPPLRQGSDTLNLDPLTKTGS